MRGGSGERPAGRASRLAGLTRFSLFFENSTRTLFSFEVAGARVANFDSEVADHPTRSAIRKQVEMGVAVRMAVLDVLTRDHRQSVRQSVPGTKT